jgi:hypothetical protein
MDLLIQAMPLPAKKPCPESRDGQAAAWNSNLRWLHAPIASNCDTKSRSSATSSEPPLRKLRFERVPATKS